MKNASMLEMKRLAGLAPRYPYGLHEAKDEEGVDPVHPGSPEDDQDPLATPPPDDQEPPDTTGAEPPKQWDLYKEMQEKAMKLATENAAMLKKMSEITEDEMEVPQKKALKAARTAVAEAVKAQKEAFRKISEFGSYALGK